MRREEYNETLGSLTGDEVEEKIQEINQFVKEKKRKGDILEKDLTDLRNMVLLLKDYWFCYRYKWIFGSRKTYNKDDQWDVYSSSYLRNAENKLDKMIERFDEAKGEFFFFFIASVYRDTGNYIKKQKDPLKTEEEGPYGGHGGKNVDTVADDCAYDKTTCSKARYNIYDDRYDDTEPEQGYGRTEDTEGAYHREDKSEKILTAKEEERKEQEELNLLMKEDMEELQSLQEEEEINEKLSKSLKSAKKSEQQNKTDNSGKGKNEDAHDSLLYDPSYNPRPLTDEEKAARDQKSNGLGLSFYFVISLKNQLADTTNPKEKDKCKQRIALLTNHFVSLARTGRPYYDLTLNKKVCDSAKKHKLKATGNKKALKTQLEKIKKGFDDYKKSNNKTGEKNKEYEEAILFAKEVLARSEDRNNIDAINQQKKNLKQAKEEGDKKRVEKIEEEILEKQRKIHTKPLYEELDDLSGNLFDNLDQDLLKFTYSDVPYNFTDTGVNELKTYKNVLGEIIDTENDHLRVPFETRIIKEYFSQIHAQKVGTDANFTKNIKGKAEEQFFDFMKKCLEGQFSSKEEILQYVAENL